MGNEQHIIEHIQLHWRGLVFRSLCGLYLIGYGYVLGRGSEKRRRGRIKLAQNRVYAEKIRHSGQYGK